MVWLLSDFVLEASVDFSQNWLCWLNRLYRHFFVRYKQIIYHF